MVLGRPLMDMWYFPIQMRVIDYVQDIEKRNSFTYTFSHEVGLYIGQVLDCLIFIVAARYISDSFALRYALLLIGVIQLISAAIAKNIISQLDKKTVRK